MPHIIQIFKPSLSNLSPRDAAAAWWKNYAKAQFMPKLNYGKVNHGKLNHCKLNYGKLNYGSYLWKAKLWKAKLWKAKLWKAKLWSTKLRFNYVTAKKWKVEMSQLNHVWLNLEKQNSGRTHFQPSLSGEGWVNKYDEIYDLEIVKAKQRICHSVTAVNDLCIRISNMENWFYLILNMSDSIITLDVGGQIFKTQLSTLTKYPESMLAKMFNHIDSGLGMYFNLYKAHCISYYVSCKDIDEEIHQQMFRCR